MLFAAALPFAAMAQTGGTDAASRPEPLSRAQIAQMIEDRGYFEIYGLTEQKDGRWHCTALVAPGKRVAIQVDSEGTVSQINPPAGAGR